MATILTDDTRIKPCQDCGVPFIVTGRNHKRCRSCAAGAVLRSVRESARKKRGYTIFEACIDCCVPIDGYHGRKRCPECARLAQIEQSNESHRKLRESQGWIEARRDLDRKRFLKRYHNDPAYREKVIARAIERGKGYRTVENIYALLERDGPFCGICYGLIPLLEVFAYDDKPIDGKLVNIHHPHPLSKGGAKKDINNMVLAHAHCNHSLGNRTM